MPTLETVTTKTILLIESEPWIRGEMQLRLGNFGECQILSTDSPFQGLQSAIDIQPDVVVFDLSTCGMNFLTFLKELRAQPATQDIPVVLIASGLKWLDSKHLHRFRVTGIIYDRVDLTSLPQQLAKLLHWEKHLSSIALG